MTLFKDMSIDGKLRLMIVGVTVATLLSAAGVFVPWAVNRFSLEQELELRSMTASMGYSASFSLDAVEIDPASGAGVALELKEILERMVTDRDVVVAAIYYLGPISDGRLMAEYARADSGLSPPVRVPKSAYRPDTLELTADILDRNGNVSGRIYLRGDVARREEFYRRLWVAVGVALVCAFVVTALFGGIVQAWIVRPLNRLLRTTQLVRRDQDYSARVSFDSRDEIGQLSESFNEMLGQIEGQDRELRGHQQTLEAEVAERTRELLTANMKLTDARDSAEAASRAKSTFLANVSHELRTPLNAIIGYSEMVCEELTGTSHAALTPDLERINRSGKMLLSLINDILDLSKIEAGRMTLSLERFNAVDLLEDVCADLKPAAERKGNRIQLVTTGESVIVYGDRTKVRQVAGNLVGNACKFTESGEIRVVLGTRGEGTGELVTVRVEDTGRGMTAEQVDKVFEPFVQADDSIARSHGGTGLGLSISRRLCETMGGSLSATSSAGRGSAFTASFVRVYEKRSDPPFPRKPDAFEGVDIEPRDLAPARNRTVLVVDDDDAARELLCRHLARDGFRVVSASSGEAGLRLAREAVPDLITLDVCMPGMTGWEFTRKVRDEPALSEIPIVIVTMLQEAEQQYDGVAAGFLLKPVKSGDLLRVACRLTGC
jgi:signal transduction histidine kinase